MSHKLAKFIKRQYQASKSASSKYLGRRLGDRPLLPSSIANVTTGTFAGLMGGMAIGNTFFEGFRRLRPRYEARSARDDGPERRRPEKNCIPIAFASLLAIAILPVLASSAASAAPYTLSISFVDSSSNEDISSPTMELNVSPSKNGTFSKSNTSTIGVGTTSATGYTLSIAASNSNGDKLVNSSDNNTDTNYIASITDTEGVAEEAFRALPSDGSESDYNNKWGYLPSMWNGDANNLFRPAPTTAGHVLNTTGKANTVTNNTASDVCKRYACDKYDLTVGARVDVSQKIGTYSNTYVVYATANGTPYTIVFKDDTVSGMPSDISSNSASSTVTIPTDLSKPTRDGYSFIGWCSGTVSHNANGTDTCSGTVYQNGSTWAITEGATTNNLTLYAMWGGNYTIDALTTNGNTLYMQDFANMSAEKKAKVISSMTTGTAYTVKDTRHASNEDEPEYKIAKLKDGNVWMLDNLRLGSNSESIALTPGDTNIISNYALPKGTTSGIDSFTVAQINATHKNESVTSYGQGSGRAGVYYNYCAASSGTYCTPNGNNVDLTDTIIDSPQDVCPAGWRLSTGGPTGEYNALVNIYSASKDATNPNSLQYNLSAALAGEFRGQTQQYTTESNIWSSTLDEGGNRMYKLLMSSTSTFASGSSYVRNVAIAVRCLLK